MRGSQRWSQETQRVLVSPGRGLPGTLGNPFFLLDFGSSSLSEQIARTQDGGS